MIDLFFKVLVQTGSSEKAYGAVSNEINKRRLGFDNRSMGYDEAKRTFSRVVSVVEEVKRLKEVFKEG
ncbi:uncharacterized protein Eint_060085 [Encephalitozoon intestinalis ATCC 50506]|uniref:Uncharacterized protein n=1 Tax=Encephalitozoon intestinalis (strain ATCC 50506) TaxID=876142 RepID=W8PGQ6_ENCIT|nr:uncharacterized protein Eint_060085 [Encephalitozoon intestinalis ATCC 50506]AHL30111.1 hypothetical protein Eint_060085 [Encephalitozoon intestinalis ATCC 50506]UTX45348.1 hypothetical protein GPK93_06g08990 [Encephalitozoon intestinalis]